MQIIYISDLFNTNEGINYFFKKNGFNNLININWLDYDYADQNFMLDYMIDILITEINKIKEDFIVIIDSFSVFIFIEALKYLDQKKIKKIILLNPISKNIYLKLINLKKNMIPNNVQQLIYQKMYFFHNFEKFRNNEILINSAYKSLDFIYENNFKINRLLNEIFNLKKIKEVIVFCKKPNLKIMVGDHNPLLSKKDYQLLCNNNFSIFIIKNSGFYLFDENFNDCENILNKLIYG